jgi:hypothetical protein
VTVHLTNRFRVIDTFRFSNFRIPGVWAEDSFSLFPGATPATLLTPVTTFDAATCPPPFTAAACPKHSSSSPADVAGARFARFLGQDSKYNTVELEYDFTKRVGVRAGYRYGHRRIPFSVVETVDELYYPNNANRGNCVGQPLNADGSCTFIGEVDNESGVEEVNEHSGLFGVWAHPTDAVRVNFDMELFSGDNAPTRITPRNLQRYKFRTQFKPKDWINVSGSINVLESRNNVLDIGHREHNRNYGFTLLVMPNARFNWEFGYNYDDIFSTTNICYVIGGTVPPGSPLCSSGAPFLSAASLYDNKVNFGYTNFMVRPVKRVALNFGYNLTSTSGNTLILGPTPGTLGVLGLNYHKPTAAVDVDLARGFTWRTAWGYWGYNEKSDAAPLPPRDFHSNSATLSLKYAF